ncbi:uncharacterized protein LOC122250845 [Penaeus japonicus]|uniref:uncharacterized protein LOC122250845 n=1 Tax=Penaeus japonicus TaxID=27405 RepID=UPI001C70CA9E|nr:uncharacterized protein LOC122250845 [Penaeus japonicus]
MPSPEQGTDDAPREGEQDHKDKVGLKDLRLSEERLVLVAATEEEAARAEAARDRLLTVLSVRHPLSRLTSAYRDKFLGGKPISRYDASWRAETQSEQSWKYRWEAYWLPALISRGDIQPSSWLKLRRVKMLTVSDPCTQTMFSNHGLAKRMNQDYQSQMNKYIDRFKGSSFSFEDFLRHILWSRDHGILDYHWAPQTCLCDMCTKRYDFILHTESATQESKHVFAAAGSKRQLSVSNLHSTKAVSESSREVYFDRVADRTLSEILHLYWNDFELFGYEI